MSHGNKAYINTRASDDFNRARSLEKLFAMLSLLKPEKRELLSFYQVKSLLRPKRENYLGMRVVALNQIAGSEGRYRDFNKAFLPRKEHLRHRWESIDKAHLTDVTLPPIKLYKIGEAYFVRDGNHRVSVARTQGVEAIDAEVVELDSAIEVQADWSQEQLKEALIQYERSLFLRQTGLSQVIEDAGEITFTAPGRYDEMLQHILGHKYYINQGVRDEITLEQAALSWYNNLFKPALTIIEEEKLQIRFPGRTLADLYVWTIKHWDLLKKRYGDQFTMKDAVKDYSHKYGVSLGSRIINALKGLFQKG